MSDLFLNEVIRPEPDSGGGSGRPARRGGREERERRRRERRRRNTIALVISLVLLGAIAFAVVRVVLPMIDDLTGGGEQQQVTDFPGPGHGEAEVSIPAQATGAQMGEVLEEAGVVASTGAFTDAFSANPDAAGIQPGTYSLLLEMNAADAVDALLDPENRVQTRVTIPEGLRVEQVVERLSSVTAVPVEDFMAALEDTEATGLPEQAPDVEDIDKKYEGWLFPATYTFEPGTEPVEMIARMVQEMVSVLDDQDVAEEDRLTVLTKASLVEREARSEEDRRKVARAIQNRLDASIKLDIDASVAYGLGIPGTELTREHLRTDGPYNTYTRTGLPPTPIAAPSVTSIEAVLSPADGPWMYWVTVNLETGETKFAETLPEHDQNVAELREWQDQQE